MNNGGGGSGGGGDELEQRIAKLEGAVNRIEKKINAPMKSVGYWVQVAVPIVIGLLALSGVNARFDAADKRLESLIFEMHRLDDRLSGGVAKLTDQIAALDKREAVDHALKRR